MFGDSIVPSSAGTLCVAAVAMATLSFLLWRRAIGTGDKAGGWGAQLAATTVLYSLAVFVQFNSPEGSANHFAEKLQYVCFPALVHGVHGYTFESLNLPTGRYHRIATPLHTLLLVLILATDLFVGTGWVARDFVFLSAPYVEPALGPLGVPLLLYCGVAVTLSLRHWLRAASEGRPGARTFVLGFSVWVLAALHDIAATVGLPTAQFVMEYGFLGFSLGVAAVWMHEAVARQAAAVARQEEADAAKTALEQRVAVQFEHSPLAYVQWDLDYRVTEWNPAAEAIFGWTKEEAMGRQPLGWLTPEELRDRVELIWLSLLDRSGGTWSVNENHTKGGDEIICEWHNTPLLGADGEVVGVASLAQDITDRVRAEADLKRAREFAEAASQAKSQFLANMSHEIRTPMNGVMGMLDLLGNTPLDGRQRALLDGAVRSSETLLHIINEILDLSRIEAGKLALEAREFDVRDVVEEAVGLFAEGAHQAGLVLACTIEDDVPAVLEGDPLRLTQIIANLLGNALKFTSEGSIDVEVTLAERNPDWPLVHFEVRDTGIGVTREKRKQIFRSFAQEDATTTRRYGGSGLGLAICQRLSQQMGGTTGLSSAPGEGSTFWFTVRLKNVVADDPEDVEAREALSGRRALVVAGEEETAAFGRRLRRWGMPWAGADAFNVLDRLDVGGWDLVVVDEVQPETSGIVVSRLMKNLPPETRPPVLMVASVGLQMDEARAKELGIDAWLTRPLRTKALRGSLLTLVAGREPSQPAETGPEDGRTGLKFAARVLLAEDNAVNRVVGQTMLEDAGCRVLHAADGDEAVARAEAESFDLILMDCQMPVMDGYEATRAIRAGDGPNAETPIIAVTAHAMADARDTCLAAGMTDYLAKPFRRAELERILARWLTGAVAVEEEGAGPVGPAIDAGRLEEVLGFDSPGRDSLLERLAMMWRDDGELLVAEIRHDWAVGDLGEVQDGALALGRTADGIGGVRLAGLARQLARAAEELDIATLERLIPQLPAEHKALCEALDEELAPDPDPDQI